MKGREEVSIKRVLFQSSLVVQHEKIFPSLLQNVPFLLVLRDII